MIDKAKNSERANRARKALLYYKGHILGETGPLHDEDIVDLLTDLRHYITQFSKPSDAGFFECARMSGANFEAEIWGEDDDA